MKKIYYIAIILLIAIAALVSVSCGGGSAVTLDSMQNTLIEAGYEVLAITTDIVAFEDHNKNISRNFIFSAPEETEEFGWTRGFIVLEFKTASSARKFINAIVDGGAASDVRQWFPRNGKFVAGPLIGLTENITQGFLEKLVNGETVPSAETAFENME